MARKQQFSFEVVQDGIVVAGVVGNDEHSVVGEILHYGRVYAQDGAVTIRGTNARSRRALEIFKALNSVMASQMTVTNPPPDGCQPEPNRDTP